MSAHETQPRKFVPDFVPFDERRNLGDLRRADIIFGPDMFDPRVVDGCNPLGDALEEAVLEGKLEDLGVPRDALDGKTVVEVWGDVSLQELTAKTLEVTHRLEPKPPVTIQRQGFLRRVLSFAR